MVKTILVTLVLCAMVAGTAAAASWVDELNPISSIGNDYPGWVEVTTTATNTGSGWLWEYLVKPTGDATKLYANNIDGFTIVLGPTAGALVTSITTPTGWGTPSVVPADGSIHWTTPADGAYVITTGNTALFSYMHPWGPVASADARAFDSGIYDGYVRCPAVPEPMSIFLGALGLSTIGGFRRLRRK